MTARPVRIELTYVEGEKAGRLTRWSGEAPATPALFEALYSQAVLKVEFEHKDRSYRERARVVAAAPDGHACFKPRDLHRPTSTKEA